MIDLLFESSKLYIALSIRFQSFSLQQIFMKRQMVTIDFKRHEGLVLNWNFLDLNKKNNFYRHILVLLTSNMEIIKTAIQNYIKNIKWGDLYTTIYMDSSRLIKLKKWREKTIMSDFAPQTYFKEQKINSITYDQVQTTIHKQIQEINAPTIINFIVETHDQAISLKTKLKSRHILKKKLLISTILSPACPNNISICDGVNIMSIKQPIAFEFYHQYLNQMAIQFAHLIITCRNGEIGSCNQNNWKNTAFNKIQRTYYGPSIQYKQDVLHFINTKRFLYGNFDLDVSLQFICFGGKRYKSQKKITINVDKSLSYQRTISFPDVFKAYYSREGIQLEESPFTSKTLVYYQQANEQSKEHDLSMI